jgi:hypothetical protein
MGDATAGYSQIACSTQRKIKHAATDPRPPVSNAHNYGFVICCFGYANFRAER